jgi:hypothetical protein
MTPKTLGGDEMLWTRRRLLEAGFWVEGFEASITGSLPTSVTKLSDVVLDIL